VSDAEWRQSPDGDWWFRGPDGAWHPGDIGPEERPASDLARPPAAPNWGPGSGTSTLPKAPPLPPADAVQSSDPSTLAAGAWLAIIAGVLAVVGSFLPWEHFSALFVTVNRNGFQLGANEGFSVDGLIILLLGMVTVIIGITKLTRTVAPRFLQRSSIVTGIAIAVVAALEISPIRQNIRTVENASSAASGSVGFGLWLAIISGVVAVVAGLMIRSNQA
jgi:hypothetical protein